MTPDELRICNVVDTLIKKNRSFALWRIPGESPRFAMQTSGSARLLYHIEELDEQSGFVIAPFHVSKQHPIVLIRPDIQELPSDEEIKVSCLWNKSSMPTEQEFHHSETLVSYPENPKEDYNRRFNTFIEPLHRKQFEKLVLSRSQTIPAGKTDFSPAAAFHKAIERYKFISAIHPRRAHGSGVRPKSSSPARKENGIQSPLPAPNRSKTGNSRQNGTTKTGKSRNMWPSTSASSCKH